MFDRIDALLALVGFDVLLHFYGTLGATSLLVLVAGVYALARANDAV